MSEVSKAILVEYLSEYTFLIIRGMCIICNTFGMDENVEESMKYWLLREKKPM